MAVKSNPVSRQTGIVVQELKGEVLIYDLQINKAYCLNETSAFVYGLCDGNNSVAEISKELSRKLKSTVPDDVVWLAIDQLKNDNLLENGFDIKTKFNGLSRREVIRRAGLASMIALPMISSLLAPTAAHAQSGACTTAASCPGTDTACRLRTCTAGVCGFANVAAGVGCGGFGQVCDGLGNCLL